MPAPTVLTVLPDLPFPAVTGLQLRMAANLRIVREVAGRSTALWFGDDSADVELLREACDEAVHAGAPALYSSFSVRERARQRARFVSEALARRGGDRYPFSLGYDAIGAARRIRDAARRVEPDYVLLPTFLSHYAPGLVADGRRVIGDAADVMTDQTRSFVRIYGRRRPWRFPGLLANHLAARSQERLFLPLCAEVWANSEQQARRLRQVAPGVRAIVVGNVLDEEAVRATPLPETPAVGFIGSYFYLPNLDAARCLAEAVFPALRRHEPDARLLLAGGGMAQDVSAALDAIPGVEVLGRVPDSREFMASCRTLAFPLFFESGPPLKVVEALACGRPVVGSPQLAEALGLSDGRGVLVGRDAEEIAVALARLLREHDLAAKLAEEGRRLFEERLSLGFTIAEVRRDSVLAQAPA